MRVGIGTAELEELVSDKVAELQGKGESFTAFGVTTALRSENPNLEIEHSEVRDLVRTAVDRSLYTSASKDFGGYSAVEYSPISSSDPNTMTSYTPGALGNMFASLGIIGTPQVGNTGTPTTTPTPSTGANTAPASPATPAPITIPVPTPAASTPAPKPAKKPAPRTNAAPAGTRSAPNVNDPDTTTVAVTFKGSAFKGITPVSGSAPTLNTTTGTNTSDT